MYEIWKWSIEGREIVLEGLSRSIYKYSNGSEGTPGLRIQSTFVCQLTTSFARKHSMAKTWFWLTVKWSRRKATRSCVMLIRKMYHYLSLATLSGEPSVLLSCIQLLIISKSNDPHRHDPAGTSPQDTHPNNTQCINHERNRRMWSCTLQLWAERFSGFLYRNMEAK